MNKKLVVPQEIIEGSKGKGGGGAPRAAQEAPNTLSSRAIVKVVEVLSEGEIVGIVGGGRGVYINDTPFQNSNGSYNFSRAGYSYSVGLPDQPVLIGYENTSSEFAIGAIVTTTSPWNRTVTAADIDAVKVTVGLPQGLYIQDTTNGDVYGSEVRFTIQHKLTSSGTWSLVGNYIISGKSNTATEKQYLVPRPAGTGTWDIRVTRNTTDSEVASLRNQTAINRVSEILYTKEPYNNSAVVGIQIDAESVGNQIPKRSYLVKGVIVKVPSNYVPSSRTYSGIWDGTFINAWTDNPAWILYDLLTNARYGLGEFVSESDVDKFSFYDAGVYSDALVPDGKGGTEPRFTFNAVIQSRDEAYRLLTAVAGSMRSTLIYAGGQVRVLQDRPEDVVKLVTKANVIDGLFDYKSTGLFDRHTAYNVTYADRTDRHLPRTVTVDTSNIASVASNYQAQLVAAEARYGYNSVDITAFGATTEGQAIRHALWALDTELTQTEIAQFKMSLNGFDLLPGDIIKIYDEDYVGTRGGGRIVSVSGTTVVLDRAITLAAGSTIDVVLADGKTIEQRAIVETSGTLSTITVASAFSTAVLPNADFIATVAASARQFKLVGITQEEAGIVVVEAVLHDPNKFSRVEQNVNIPPQTFSNVQSSVCNAPTGLTFREVQINDADSGLNGLRRTLIVSWIRPTQGQVREYNVRYRVGSGEWMAAKSSTNSYEINPAFGGPYEVDISAVSIQGNVGPAATGTFTVQTAGGGASLLLAPTSLTVEGGGNAFGGADINFRWTNPAANADVLTATLRDFEVRFVSGSTLRTIYVPAVAAGADQTASYSYSMNVADGGPRRTVTVEVRCRDASNNLSNPVSATFTNPVPNVPSNISAIGALGSARITYTLPVDLDFKGILVWRATTSGFVPNADNLIYDGSDSFVADNAIQGGVTHYYRIAAYDLFSKDLSGATLSLSAEYSATPISNAGIPSGPVNPGTGTQGDLFYNTSDNKLYRYTGTEWSAKVPTVDLTGTVSNTQIAAGSVTADKIAANTITADQIAANAITASELAADSVTAGKIAAASVSSSEIAANTIVADNIATNTITAELMQAGVMAADNVLTRGLTVRDNSGNIILAAGNALDYVNVGGATKPENNATFGAGFDQYSTAEPMPTVTFTGVNTTVVGNTVTKTGGVDATWDADYRSTQGFVGRAVASARMAASNVDVMIGLNSDPTTDASFASIDFALFATSTGSVNVYQGGNLVGTNAASYVAGDELRIEYTGVNVYYYRNTTVIYTSFTTAGRTMYFDSSFNGSGDAIIDVSFTSDRFHGADVNITGDAATKTGLTGWGTGQVYSTFALTSAAYAELKVPSLSSNTMFGLNADPITDASFTSIDYAIHPESGGALNVYEGGVFIGNFGTWTPEDELSVRYSGTSITYRKNGITFRTTSTTAGRSFFFDSALEIQGNQFSRMVFQSEPIVRTTIGNVTGTITGRNASTYISDLAVGTLQIADQAVTLPVAVTNFRSLDALNGVFSADIIASTMNVISTGAPCIVFMTWAHLLPTGSGYPMVQLLVNGTSVYTDATLQAGFSAMNRTIRVPAGNNLIQLRLYNAISTATFRIGSTSLTYLELKK